MALGTVAAGRSSGDTLLLNCCHSAAYIPTGRRLTTYPTKPKHLTATRVEHSAIYAALDFLSSSRGGPRRTGSGPTHAAREEIANVG